MSVLASLAGAVVWMGELPVKLNPVIQPLMAAIKREQVLKVVFSFLLRGLFLTKFCLNILFYANIKKFIAFTNL